MGIIFTPAKATATRPDAPGLVFPGATINGMEFWHLFTDGLANLSRNWAPGKNGGALAGSPIDRGGYVNLYASNNYLTTSQQDPAGDSSMLFVAQAIGDQDPQSDYSQTGKLAYYGGSSDGNAKGEGLYVINTGAVAAQASYSVNGAAYTIKAAQVAANPKTWRCWIARFSSTAVTLDDMTGNQRTVTALPANSVKVSSGLPVKIGSADGAARTGQINMLLAAGASRAWTDDECALLYRQAKGFAALKGIAC